MTRRRLCTAVIAVALGLGGSDGAATDTAPAGTRPAETARVRVAYTSSFLPEVSESDARAAIKAWALALAKEIGVSAQAEIVATPTGPELACALEEARVDLGGMTTSELFTVEDRVDLEPMFAIVQGATAIEEYVILVSNRNPARSLADLRGAALKTHDNPRMSLALPWLELSLAEIKAGSPDRFFREIESSTKLTSALLPVFFGQADACLVTRQGFQTAAELNPQIARELRVLALSPPVIPLVWFLRRSYRPTFRARFVEALVDLHESPTGRQILNLIQGDRTATLTPESLADTRELVRRWRQATGRPPLPTLPALHPDGLAVEGDR